MIKIDKNNLTEEELDSAEFAFVELMNACDAYN